MEYTNPQDESLDFIKKQLATEPVINVITKDEFEERVYKVFTILWEKLSKSFGPGGAGTFISVYPSYYNTKDGFTIMKNIAFDKKLDQVISDMVMNVCSRLNFTVGDGTTTATIATRSTYESYINNKNFFVEHNLLPRDILKKFETYKNMLLERIDNLSTPIRSNDPTELRKNIEKVVFISSNGNREITNMIGSLYEELMYPAISCGLSQDGTMKSSIIEGYKTDISITDKLYINNDNNTMMLTNGADVVIFDHKIMKETYEKILKPLSTASMARGRHLICIAPFYDETALSGVIKSDLNAEYRKRQDINLVLMACAKATGDARIDLEDLAMLLNTTVISPTMENDYLEVLNNGESIYKLFNMDLRKIENSVVCIYAGEDNDTLKTAVYHDGISNLFNYFDSDKGIRVGYCGRLNLGLKVSTFSDFYYDENMYNTTLSVAKSELDEVQKKCEKLGAFSFELVKKQKRVYSLGLKTGLIEVGSTSELSQGYLKDAVDDAVKAAASAYNNGVVLGCNVSLMKAISDMINTVDNEVDKALLNILLSGFMSVCETVFSNVFTNLELSSENIADSGKEVSDIMINRYDFKDFNMDTNKFIYAPDVYKYLIFYSIATHQVLDLSTGIFNNEVINSSEADKEILKATIDLLSLLITGNQLVLC